MQAITINGVELKATKTEVRFALDCQDFIKRDPTKVYAQKHIDIIMRSAPDDKSFARRQAIASALGLNDQIQYL